MPVTTAHRTPDKESITELVHAFYADVRKDDLLGPVFDKALHGQWDAHLHRLVDFWSTVLLGTRSFKGNVLDKHLSLQDVTPAHFAAWVTCGMGTPRACLPPKWPTACKPQPMAWPEICSEGILGACLRLQHRVHSIPTRGITEARFHSVRRSPPWP